MKLTAGVTGTIRTMARPIVSDIFTENCDKEPCMVGKTFYNIRGIQIMTLWGGGGSRLCHKITQVGWSGGVNQGAT
jgi:hypothetical protein